MAKNKAKVLNTEFLNNTVAEAILLLAKLNIKSATNIYYEDVDGFIYRMVYIAELQFPTVKRGGLRLKRKY